MFEIWAPETRRARNARGFFDFELPATLADDCLGPPQEQVWRLRYRIARAPAGVSRLRICQTRDGARTCFLDQLAPAGRPWREVRFDDDVAPPPLDPVANDAERAPVIRYELTAWSARGPSSRRILERHLALFPHAQITDEGHVAGPNPNSGRGFYGRPTRGACAPPVSSRTESGPASRGPGCRWASSRAHHGWASASSRPRRSARTRSRPGSTTPPTTRAPRPHPSPAGAGSPGGAAARSLAAAVAARSPATGRRPASLSDRR